MKVAKRILMPIDGSGNSLRALAYLAKRAQADKLTQIVLLNVQARLPNSKFVTRAMIKEHHASQSDLALTPARKLLARLHLKSDNYVRSGEPAQTIVEVARLLRCSEIVMGTRGLGGLKGLILGSITTKVIHLAKTPVTVVP